MKALSLEAIAFKRGVYRHYSGKYYYVEDVIMHTETSEELVLYRSLNGDNQRWLRPFEMFIQMVEYQGVNQPRFEYQLSFKTSSNSSL